MQEENSGWGFGGIEEDEEEEGERNRYSVRPSASALSLFSSSFASFLRFFHSPLLYNFGFMCMFEKKRDSHVVLAPVCNSSHSHQSRIFFPARCRSTVCISTAAITTTTTTDRYLASIALFVPQGMVTQGPYNSIMLYS